MLLVVCWTFDTSPDSAGLSICICVHCICLIWSWVYKLCVFFFFVRTSKSWNELAQTLNCCYSFYANLPLLCRPAVSFLSSILHCQPLPESHLSLTTPTATPTNCYPLRSQLLQFLLPVSEVQAGVRGEDGAHLNGSVNGLPTGRIKLVNRYCAWRKYSSCIGCVFKVSPFWILFLSVMNVLPSPAYSPTGPMWRSWHMLWLPSPSVPAVLHTCHFWDSCTIKTGGLDCLHLLLWLPNQQ